MGIPPQWYSNFLHLVNSLYSFFCTEASFYTAIDKTFRDLGIKTEKWYASQEIEFEEEKKTKTKFGFSRRKSVLSRDL